MLFILWIGWFEGRRLPPLSKLTLTVRCSTTRNLLALQYILRQLWMWITCQSLSNIFFINIKLLLCTLEMRTYFLINSINYIAWYSGHFIVSPTLQKQMRLGSWKCSMLWNSAVIQDTSMCSAVSQKRKRKKACAQPSRILMIKYQKRPMNLFEKASALRVAWRS